jgi:hypothetical protein
MADKTERNGPKTAGRGREATQFKPGCAPGPGRPRGSKDRITELFLASLAADFEQHGPGVIAVAREQDPVGYLRLVAGLVPKESTIELVSPPL